jgi:hypothetical protein
VGVVGLAGCGGPGTANISGKIFFNDKPLKGGNVTFIPENGQAISDQIGQDGSYSLQKVPRGKVKICVQTSHLKTTGQTGPMTYRAPKGAEKPGGEYAPPDRAANARRYVAIPDKYENPSKTDLTYTVEGGDVTYDIKLK